MERAECQEGVENQKQQHGKEAACAQTTVADNCGGLLCRQQNPLPLLPEPILPAF